VSHTESGSPFFSISLFACAANLRGVVEVANFLLARYVEVCEKMLVATVRLMNYNYFMKEGRLI
jgi:hypothetical protein